jgi:hypothetical protein
LLQKRKKMKSLMSMIQTVWILLVNLKLGDYVSLVELRRRRKRSFGESRRGRKLREGERCRRSND